MALESIIEGIVWSLGEAVFSVIEYPGAWIHWRLKKKKLSFKNIVERYFGINLLLSVMLYCTIAFIIYIII